MTHQDFNLVREQKLKEVGGIVRLWEHKKTGAQLMSVMNDDENKTFGVAFRTPPKNSTGVAHILEHSVLCGSEKYPVKEPFAELLKSSLQTFLNALTFPDKTCYPVASTNLQDFYNLIDVYLDAVFYPRINEHTLFQEGWHIHADDENTDNWHFKGVVYNEMKGVYSSPDSVLAEQTQNSIFPHTLYSLDSGGDPADILNLGYQEFKDFHTRYYHPSNARFFFWGDDSEDVRLDRLAEALKNFDRLTPDSSVELQKTLDYARKIEVPYVVQNQENQENSAKNAHVTVNWLLCEGKDAEEIMMLEMLEHILTALPGSPLRKALMDSGLGEDVTGCGLETDLRQAYFSIGLRSILPTDGDKVEILVMDTLAGIVEDGLSEKSIQSAISSTEFMFRENNTGSFPRGLSAMFQSLSTWLYDEDPFLPLAWEKPLMNIKNRLQSGEKVFENAIKKWFLDNNHRTCVVLLPDEDLAEQRTSTEKARLQYMIKDLSAEQRIEIVQLSADLAEAQEREDGPEALATIPTLTLADIPNKGKEFPFAMVEQNAITLLHHEIDTNGILYVRMMLPLERVSQEDLPLLSLYCRGLSEMGTQKRDFVDLGLELSITCGALDANVAILTRVDDTTPQLYLKIYAKVVEEKIPALRELMHEVFCMPNFNNKERFVQMAWEDKARFEQSIIPAGHSLLASFLSGMQSPADQILENMGGLPYWNYIRTLCDNIQNNTSIEEQLTLLHEKVMCFDTAIVSLTGSADLIKKGECFKTLVQEFPKPKNPIVTFTYNFDKNPTGLLVPAQVNYVGLGSNMKAHGYTFHGSSHVIGRFLRMGYLWDRVRVQGGAYGAFVRYSRSSGNILFLSYRDPNVERTLDIYKKAAEYLGNLTMSSQELTKTVVGTMGDIDAYLLPSAKGNAALVEYMIGYTKEMKAKTREEVLGTKLSDLHDFAPYLQKAIDTAIPSALGGHAVTEYAKVHNWKTVDLL